MKLFVITTVSENNDHYIYLIKHDQYPTKDELKAFLIKNANDKSDYTLYEWITEVVEISEADAMTIPKVSKKTLDKWSEL